MEAKRLQWAMREWLTCQSLSPFQRNLVNSLLEAAETSEVFFHNLREQFERMFAKELLEAINKARAEGLCRQWPQDA